MCKESNVQYCVQCTIRYIFKQRTVTTNQYYTVVFFFYLKSALFSSWKGQLLLLHAH